MFESLIGDAKASAGSFVAKYLTRASVALPFAIALGFATASVTLILIASFGPIIGCAMVAGGFTAIGLISALAVGIKEHEDAIAARPANSQAGTPEAAASNAALPIDVPALAALVIPFILSQLEAATADKGANMIIRNIPLMTLAAVLALLLWPVEAEADAGQSEAASNKPNGTSPPGDDTDLRYGAG